MAVTLGKRKRREEAKPQTDAERDASSDDETAKALFQRAFEAKFKPLEKPTNVSAEESENDLDPDVDGDGDAESDWSGLSEEDEAEVQVVEAAKPSRLDPHELKLAKKSFMSSKPPTEIDDIFDKPRKKSKPETADEDGTEAVNLKNDLALQRLLKESHLLDPDSFRTSSSTVEGKGRIKALDMRLQDLGAKTSVLQQEKMPLSHRKGIVAKASSREAKRRQEAAENGIILEKAKFAAKSNKKRERGIGGPGVGKFRGGTLQLSAKDVRSIQDSGRKGRRK